MKAFLTLPAALLVVACATGPEADYAMTAEDRAELDRELEGYVAEAPENCLDIRFVNNSRTIDERTVVYREGNRKYLTTFDDRCPALDRLGEALVFRTFAGRVCDVDIIQTVDTQTGIQSGACSIDTITPYRRVD
ncbi:DUF6491 family protein [Sphingomicrobium sp. XHP0239]|uniref:DUF6491 family protein n=1 Tax=Sphingomicrobium maritimum TaxID=3133972 RepID=UPI0031CCA4C0